MEPRAAFATLHSGPEEDYHLTSLELYLLGFILLAELFVDAIAHLLASCPLTICALRSKGLPESEEEAATEFKRQQS